MNSYRLFAFLIIAFTAFSACDPESKTNYDSHHYILPIGDSRVQGNRPSHESYRFELWQLLINENWHFDFVGNRSDDAEYPEHDNLVFDPDHQGIGGARTADILSEVGRLDRDSMPNVVLLGIGGNDLANGAETVETVVSNIDEIIDVLQEKNPTISIFLEQIAPGHSSFMNEQRWLVFNEFKAAVSQIATRQTNANSIVVAVDMSENWKDEYMTDNVHYSVSGAKIIASRYMDAITLYLDR